MTEKQELLINRIYKKIKGKQAKDKEYNKGHFLTGKNFLTEKRGDSYV